MTSTIRTWSDDDTRRNARTVEDERNTGRCFVDEKAVRQFAMFTEHLTMVGDDDDQRLVETAIGAKRVDQAADLCVRARDFGVVRAIPRSREARLHRFGRFVRRVRVVEMDPGKERPVPFRPQPLERAIDDLGSGALDHVHRRRRSRSARDRTRRSSDRSPARSPSADRGRMSQQSRRCEIPGRAGPRRA